MANSYTPQALAAPDELGGYKPHFLTRTHRLLYMIWVEVAAQDIEMIDKAHDDVWMQGPRKS